MLHTHTTEQYIVPLVPGLRHYVCLHCAEDGGLIDRVGLHLCTIMCTFPWALIKINCISSQKDEEMRMITGFPHNIMHDFNIQYPIVEPHVKSYTRNILRNYALFVASAGFICDTAPLRTEDGALFFKSEK